MIHHGYAVAGRFGQADIARDDGAVHLVAEVALQLVGYLLRKRVARIEHGAQQAFDFEFGVYPGRPP